MAGFSITPFARYLDSSGLSAVNRTLDTAGAADAMKKIAEYIEWPVQYYTGSDVSFYLFQGNQYQKLEEVAACMYNLEEQVLPLRSYADYTPRKIVKGAYIVVGTIAIFYTSYDWLEGQVGSFNEHLEQIVADNEEDDAPELGEGLFDNIDDVSDDTWNGPENIVDNAWSATDFNKPRFDMPPFNLLISIGVAKEDDVIGASSTPKSRLIVGCNITSKTVAYSNDGQPLVETYQFIALNEIPLKAAETQQTSDALNTALQTTPATSKGDSAPKNKPRYEPKPKKPKPEYEENRTLP